MCYTLQCATRVVPQDNLDNNVNSQGKADCSIELHVCVACELKGSYTLTKKKLNESGEYPFTALQH